MKDKKYIETLPKDATLLGCFIFTLITPILFPMYLLNKWKRKNETY